MKGFIYLKDDDIYLNENIIKEIKDYDTNLKIITIYGETYRVKKEIKENARR